MAFLRVTIFAAVLVLGGCSASVTLTNQSGVTVSNVVVSGSGFEERVQSIPPLSSRKLSVVPSGESALRVVFEADGQKFDSGDQGYFEGGYRIVATIATNRTVSLTYP